MSTESGEEGRDPSENDPDLSLDDELVAGALRDALARQPADTREMFAEALEAGEPIVPRAVVLEGVPSIVFSILGRDFCAIAADKLRSLWPPDDPAELAE